jgi:hypothetical protein
LNDPTRLVRVVSGQTANPYVLKQALNGATVNGTVRADVAAVAGYFSVDIDSLYQKYQSGNVNMTDVFNELRSNIDSTMANVTENLAIAQEKGLPLVAYEAGQHLVARTAEQRENTGFVELLKQINREPRMGELYTYLMEEWHRTGGKTLTLFNDMGPWTKWGTWSLREDYLDNDSVKSQAVQEYLRRIQPIPADDDGGLGEWRSTFGASDDLQADVDASGSVDAADFVLLRRKHSEPTYTDGAALWRGTYGSNTDHRADWDENGTVEAADYVLWRHTSLSTASAGGLALSMQAAQLAPEPGAVSLSMLAASIILGIRVPR